MAPEETKTPRISFTDAAVTKLNEVIANYGRPVAGLRLHLLGRGPEGFQHVLSIVPKGAEPDDDVIVETDGLTVFVDGHNVQYLDGVMVHYQYKGQNVSGLEFNNPNPLWFDPAAEKVQALFDQYINPSIAAHGGYVSLLDVKDGIAYIEMGGGCQGCGMADVTLKQGIEVAIQEAVPEISAVVDTTDHASGTNPYFSPGKK